MILVGVIVWSFIKNKRAEKERKQQELDEYEKHQQIDESVMEVNWDEIEKKYVEQSSSVSQKKLYNPGMVDNETISPILIPFQRPNAIDKISISGARNYKVQKPDSEA